MKRLAIALLCATPLLTSAQSLDIRAFGGAMLNSGTYQSLLWYDHSKLNAVGGLGVAYRTGKLEIGLDLSYRRFSFTKMLSFADEFDPLTGYSIPGSPRRYTFREPAFSVAPVLNYHIKTGRFGVYAGISPAYVRFLGVAPTDKNFTFSHGTNGYLIQAQAGCSYALLPRLRCFAELTGGSVWMPIFMSEKTRFWTGSLNLGAQFSVWKKGPDKPVVVQELQ